MFSGSHSGPYERRGQRSHPGVVRAHVAFNDRQFRLLACRLAQIEARISVKYLEAASIREHGEWTRRVVLRIERSLTRQQRDVPRARFEDQVHPGGSVQNDRAAIRQLDCLLLAYGCADELVCVQRITVRIPGRQRSRYGAQYGDRCDAGDAKNDREELPGPD